MMKNRWRDRKKKRGCGSEERAEALSTEPRSEVPRTVSSSAPLKPEHSKLARSHIQRGDGRDSSEVEQEECGRQGGKTEGAPLHHAPFSL